VSLTKTDSFASRQIRLPLFTGMTEEQVERVIGTMKSFPFTS